MAIFGGTMSDLNETGAVLQSPRDEVLALLREVAADPDGPMTALALPDCGAPGLIRIVFPKKKWVRPSNGILSVFYASPVSEIGTLFRSYPERGEDFTMLPCAHRRDAMLCRLAGRVFNVDFHFVDWPPTEYQRLHHYRSVVSNGQKSFEYQGAVNFSDTFQRLIPTDGLFLSTDQVRTVTAEKGAVWAVREGPLSRVTEDYYSRCADLRHDPAEVSSVLDCDALHRVVTDILHLIDAE